MSKKRKRRNRRKAEAGFLFPTALALILFAAASLSLSYLWLDVRTVEMDRCIKRLEERLQKARSRRQLEESNWARATSPSHLDALLQAHGLRMHYAGDRTITLTQADLPGGADTKRSRGTSTWRMAMNE